MRTLIVGASTNPERYAFKAANSLLTYGHEIAMVGQKEGEVQGVAIQTNYPDFQGIDTVTMYMGARNQPALYEYILKQNPRRIIFNPGAENPEFEALAHQQGIETEEACTLVLLATGQY
ncbi:MAG: CoA-binding protein [Arcicella sp.]|jgi:hypothetical protein|nr:CoA-binding protein [Arcicella sp.]